ncbi:IclR family transcriptional regulator domain-containing protein [Neorhizobium alkalisoli]|uniref:IclR family transcriptional regulator n=1 Tax=Neorhizobium alkalisoli TaxID=528178 RepID=A0A561R8W1_9HYPH|nr:IclR family transcriptional regulator C-terminal domain-containing protein [Neorhizobium alkalisoli]TWF59056.1 IclR family transcriptional regulator [Neorhizobium alkalisoli]
MDKSSSQRELTDKDISLTFVKGMNVLKAFDSETTHLTLPQIAKVTGLDRASARRLVLTLLHLGYVKQEDRVFSLTPRILVLASGFLQGRKFGKTIEPVLRSFSHQLSDAISMAMIDENDAVYVAHAGNDTKPASIGFTVGSRVPLLQSAIGRALVAASSPERIEELVATAPVERFTSTTLLDRKAIAQDIALTAERGFALVDGEFEAGVAAIAISARSASGEIASVGISGNSARLMEKDYFNRVVDTLRECSKTIAALL